MDDDSLFGDNAFGSSMTDTDIHIDTGPDTILGSLNTYSHYSIVFVSSGFTTEWCPSASVLAQPMQSNKN